MQPDANDPVWRKSPIILLLTMLAMRGVMDSAYLFNLASLQRGWLSARQSMVTQNIANVNTPGYKAIDVTAFSKFLDQNLFRLTGGDLSHQQPFFGDGAVAMKKDAEAWETSHSGNNVSLEAELIKEGEIRGAFAFNTNIIRTFHDMWLLSLKG